MALTMVGPGVESSMRRIMANTPPRKSDDDHEREKHDPDALVIAREQPRGDAGAVVQVAAGGLSASDRGASTARLDGS